MRVGWAIALALIAFPAACSAPSKAQFVPSSPAAKVKLDFDDAGRVKSCTIIKSTGDPRLDSKTCDFVRRCAAKTAAPKRVAQCTEPLALQKPEN
jgi:TonB family protein